MARATRQCSKTVPKRRYFSQPFIGGGCSQGGSCFQLDTKVAALAKLSDIELLYTHRFSEQSVRLCWISWAGAKCRHSAAMPKGSAHIYSTKYRKQNVSPFASVKTKVAR